jgi:low affinity Fe/Cu permease
MLTKLSQYLEALSTDCVKFTGSSLGFGLALALIILWALTGPFMHYSSLWQITINTITTIITFLMVFLIQRAQNKDVQALNIKINELLSSQNGASNKLLNIEERTEGELEEIKKLHSQLLEGTSASHSIDEIVDLGLLSND